jgi:4-phytase/acid phosphatase/peptide/nickel transport system substrate-binding protein
MEEKMSIRLIRRSVSIAATSFCMLLTALCFGQSAQAIEPQYGGTLTVGTETEPRGFDPIEAGYISTRARSYIAAVVERLFDKDEEGKIVPELALSSTSSSDGKVWTITLRRGVNFHDGTPFNADAVTSHWQRILDPANKFRGAGTIKPVQSVEKVDEFTVNFILKHPWADFLPLLTSPTSIAAHIPSPKAVKDKTQNRAPVGTGPFMFKEWLSGDKFVVVRNPNYWLKGLPYLDRVVYRPMPDMHTRFASLKSGDVDIIYTDMGKDILTAQEDPSLQVWVSDNNGAGIFYFNTEKPPFDDVRVRRAIAHAWNQEQYVETIHKGVHPVVQDPFGGELSCGDVGYRQPDLKLARQLINDYGQPVEFEYLHTSTPRGREAGVILPQMFKEIGVKVTPVPVTIGQMGRSVYQNKFQMSGWSLVDSPALGVVLSLNLHSKSRGNRSHYKNPELDKLLDTQQMSTDPEVRNEALCGIARIINEDVPLLYRLGWRHHLIGNQRVYGITNANHAVVRVRGTWLSSNKENLQANN